MAGTRERLEVHLGFGPPGAPLKLEFTLLKADVESRSLTATDCRVGERLPLVQSRLEKIRLGSAEVHDSRAQDQRLEQRDLADAVEVWVPDDCQRREGEQRSGVRRIAWTKPDSRFVIDHAAL